MVKDISDMISAVKPYLRQARIKDTSIAFSKKKVEADSEGAAKALEWLKKFHAGFCPLIDKARALVPEQVWTMYEITETTGTYEQAQLEQACHIVRVNWENRPAILKRGKGK